VSGTVVAVSSSATHSFNKPNREYIRLLAWLGVEGDAHMGATVKHRSRVAVDPSQPNLRQVHLIHSELHAELRDAGFAVSPGELGENVTTCGIDILSLPKGARLHLGDSAVVQVTGLRNPCVQLDQFQQGLLKRLVSHDERGNVIRKAGIMSVVLTGGEIHAGDRIDVELPPAPYESLDRV
jgi:MOSC domain-containing protein YiiM